MATKKTISAKTSPATKTSTTAKKASAVKKITTQKAAAAKKITSPKAEPMKENFTKPQLLSHIAEKAKLTKTQVAAVLDTLSDVIEGHIKKPTVGEFVLPELRWSDLV